MFGPGDFVEVFQRAQKVNKSITMCKSRKYHEIYFYFVKLFENLLSFRFLRIQPLHTSVAVAAADGRSSDTDCEQSNSDSSDDGTNPSSGGLETSRSPVQSRAVRKPSSGAQLWSVTVSLAHT